MSNNRFINVPDEENIEASILRKLTVERMPPPPLDDFRRFVELEKIRKATPETREIILAMSELSQYVEYLDGWTRYQNFHLRQEEAERIRLRKQLGFLMRVPRLGKIALGILLAGLLTQAGFDLVGIIGNLLKSLTH